MIQHVKILQGHEGAVYKILFDEMNRKLYSVGGDGWLVEWDADHSDIGKLLARVPDQIFALDVTVDYYLLGSFQGNFYVLDRVKNTINHQERAHKKGIYSILAGESFIYTFGGDGRIIQWDPGNYQKVNILHLSNASLRCFALDKEKSRLAVGCSDGSIYILSYPELYLQRQISDAHLPSVFTVAWVDGYLISGGRDALLKMWNGNGNYEQVRAINAHWYAIYDILTLPDYLVTCSRDKSIRWWNRQTLEPVMTIKWGEVMEAHVHSVNTLAYDGVMSRVFSGSEDRTIRVWEEI